MPIINQFDPFHDFNDKVACASIQIGRAMEELQISERVGLHALISLLGTSISFSPSPQEEFNEILTRLFSTIQKNGVSINVK